MKWRTILKLIAMVLLSAFVVGSVACEDRKKESEKTERDEADTGGEGESKEEKPQAVEPDPEKPATVGLVTVSSEKSVDEVVSELKERFDEARSVSIVGEVDHGANAGETDQELAATYLLLFSNPDLESPFINEQISAGLDFPQRVLVWEDDQGETRVTFSAPSYLVKRHGIDKLELFLGRIEKGLGNVVENATGSTVPAMPKGAEIGIEENQGIITRESQNGASDTFEKLIEVLEEADGVELFTKIDYQLSAKSVNREVGAARLVVFGNPKLGTPLMKESRTVGVDLPQKMLVYENKKGAIIVAFNDPAYLAERHGIDPEAEVIEKIDEALKKFAAKATSEISD